MKNNITSNFQETRLNTLVNDEVDLYQVLKSLLRHKIFIALVTFSTFLISGIYASTKKPLWEGKFQIVLNNKSSSSSSLNQLAAASSFLGDLSVLNNLSSSLETEVKILESPSVLNPVYNYVVREKSKAGLSTDTSTFNGWRQNLTVKLEPNTSVLNISYRDSDKELVFQVIRKISLAYQNIQGVIDQIQLTTALLLLTNK